MIKIIIYEDNASLLESLESLLTLTGRYKVVGAFLHCQQVVEQVNTLMPNLILMDMDLPEVSGVEAVKRIRQTNQLVQIIMLTIFDDNEHVMEAMYAGANGYLLKKHASEKLVNAIEEVLAGGAPMSPSIARMIINNMQQSQATVANNYQLTLREKEILQQLSQGNSFKMIAAALFISLDTVRTHIKRIYEKLQVRSQIEAVSKAINEKLV